MIRKARTGEFFVIDGDNWISRWAEESGQLSHDQNALPIILKHIKPGMTVVDGGAHIGSHTLAYCKAVGPTGRVYAIEPSQEAFEALIANCPDAVCIKAALSDRCALGAGRLVKSEDGNSGASHVRDVVAANEIPCCGDVDLLTLDSLDLHPDFIKLDLEGFELKALAGAWKTVQIFKPVMVVEINENALRRNGTDSQHLMRYIREFGYALSNLYPRQEMAGDQWDCLCLPI